MAKFHLILLLLASFIMLALGSSPEASTDDYYDSGKLSFDENSQLFLTFLYLSLGDYYGCEYYYYYDDSTASSPS
jgi:hypothetical protein